MRALRQLIGNRFPRNIDEIIRESIKLRYPFQHFSTVIISRGDIIKGITQSKPNNLILDQFGTWLAGFLRAPVNSIKTISLQDSTDTTRTLYMYNKASATTNFNNDLTKLLGSLIQVGSGSTAAARGDYVIETAFGTAPEDAVFDTGTGSYAAGSIAVAGAVIAGGAGTINETCLYGGWTHTTDLANFALFHDILTGGEAFVLGNTITVAYTINL